MPTFDIVSKYEIQEIENTVNMTQRDLLNRYDLRGTNTKIQFDKKKSQIKLESNSEMHLATTIDILEKRAVSRKVSLRTFKMNDIEKGSGMIVRQNIELQEGISKDHAKKINKLIKDAKLKVQSQIQGDQVRVTGKKIDDLQTVISFLKKENLDIPIQFVNMKK